VPENAAQKQTISSTNFRDTTLVFIYKRDLEMCDRCGDRRTIRWIGLLSFRKSSTNEMGKTEIHALLFPDGSSCSHLYSPIGTRGLKYGRREGFVRFTIGPPEGYKIYENAILHRALASVVQTNLEEGRVLFSRIDPLRNGSQTLPVPIATALDGGDSAALISILRGGRTPEEVSK
jgi:hypothetical protein